MNIYCKMMFILFEFSFYTVSGFVNIFNVPSLYLLMLVSFIFLFLVNIILYLLIMGLFLQFLYKLYHLLDLNHFLFLFLFIGSCLFLIWLAGFFEFLYALFFITYICLCTGVLVYIIGLIWLIVCMLLLWCFINWYNIYIWLIRFFEYTYSGLKAFVFWCCMFWSKIQKWLIIHFEFDNPRLKRLGVICRQVLSVIIILAVLAVVIAGLWAIFLQLYGYYIHLPEMAVDLVYYASFYVVLGVALIWGFIDVYRKEH